MLKLFKAGGSAECPQGPSACESSLNSVKYFKMTFILEVRRHEGHIFRINTRNPEIKEKILQP